MKFLLALLAIAAVAWSTPNAKRQLPTEADIKAAVAESGIDVEAVNI